MKTQQEIEKEFDEKFSRYFAVSYLTCKKCGHIKESHCWDGSGRWEYSGYDKCREEGCDCTDYDIIADFEEKIYDYNDGYEEVKSFIRKIRKDYIKNK
jgi:hypothetical protein